jgi:protocatechuate 3,4-dioxygenase beta subunit
MTHDDRMQGRILARREALAWLAAGTCALALPARAATTCVARPEQTEGPFYVDERLERSDIRGDPATGETSLGAPLALTFAVSRLTSAQCTALAGARVDVWQCDAAGRYSDVRDGRGATVDRKFLRGYQTTGADGIARFVTIVPGWYFGRTVHIHFRIDAPGANGRVQRFTSQLYFDDAFVDGVHAQAPYASRSARRTRNRDDPIWRDGGAQLMLAPEGSGEGYAAQFDIGLAGN